MTIKELWKFVKNGKYLKGMFRKSEAEVISVENPAEDYYVVKLKTEPGVTWMPGEHAMYRLPSKNVEGVDYRIFSIASIPKEGFMLLGTRAGEQISSFKKELISMQQGEKVFITGPFGWFRIRDNVSPLVLFASGVGITPIRSLLKQLENDTGRPVEIVYASSSYYLFEEEIKEIVQNNLIMSLHKTVTAEETQEKMEQLAAIYGNAAYYYISGSPAVLESIRCLLQAKGIKNNHIIDDTLKGY